MVCVGGRRGSGVEGGAHLAVCLMRTGGGDSTTLFGEGGYKRERERMSRKNNETEDTILAQANATCVRGCRARLIKSKSINMPCRLDGNGGPCEV